MEKAISITQILGTIHDGNVEVCASADADYDPVAERISVTLGAFARNVAASGNGRHPPESWLPRAELVSEHLPRADANAFTREVFHRWARKVRAAVPPDVALNP